MAITKTFTAGADRFVANSPDTFWLDFLAGDDSLTIKAGRVTGRMGLGDDFVRIDAGLATVFGHAGADRFSIYANRAVVDGGADADTIHIRGGSNHILSGGAGDDRISFVTGSAGEKIYGGLGNDLVIGNGHDIGGQIYGEQGADRFHGFGHAGARTVTLYGGIGNDIYDIRRGGEPAVVERAGEGADTVQLARGLSYTLGDNVENLTVIGGGSPSLITSLRGNVLANRITGSADAERLYGLGGNDTLSAGGGTDAIFGGPGNDRITGGARIDYVETGTGRDVIAYTSVADAPVNTAMGFEEISDFDFALDRIDVSAIDADTTRPGHQRFHLGGTRAGSIEWGVFAGMDVLLHTDDDGEADMYIYIATGTEDVPLTIDHFII